MKTLLRLCAWVTGFGLGFAAAQGVPSSPGIADVRALILVDSSVSMGALREPMAAALGTRILSGLDGELAPGNKFWIWTIGERIRADRYQPMAWSPQLAQLLSDRLSRSLRTQIFEGQARYDDLLAEISTGFSLVDELTVLLFTDGANPIAGTPFDQKLNRALQTAQSGDQTRVQLVLLTLLARHGHFVGWSVSRLGPEAPRPALAATGPVAKAIPPQAFSPQPSVQVTTNASVQNRTPVVPVPSPTSASTVRPTGSAARVLSHAGASNSLVDSPPSKADTNTPSRAPVPRENPLKLAIQVAALVQKTERLPLGSTQGMASTTNRTGLSNDNSPEVLSTTSLATAEASPQPLALAGTDRGLGSITFLAAGLVLMGAAMGLLLYRARVGRAARRASLISRSLSVEE
jgi:hypothetical protein